jgi:hypothetical protein
MHSLVVPNPNYVCTMCSQTFTRRWRGSVHNTNVHASLSHIVRLIDYIIGRLNGEYKPGDPSWYRRPNKYKNRTDGLDVIIRADKKDWFREMRRKEIQTPLGNRIPPHSDTPTHESHPQNSSESKSNLDQANRFNERIIKLAKLKRELIKYLPPERVQEILERTDLECLSEHNNSPIDVALKVVEEKVKLGESLAFLSGSER